MDKKSFMKKFAIWTAVIVAVVMLVLGLCFGRVIEETLFGEVMKWVVMTAVIIGIFEVFAYTVGQIVYDIFIRPKNGDYE
jgi:undecaprenyl pyrophosphate phosphatase UppP